MTADFPSSRAGVFVLLLTVVLCSGPLRAQMPFYTDDTGIAESRKLHVEMFDEIDSLPSSQYPDLRQNTANIKVNFSPVPNLELDVDVPYIQIYRATGSETARGIGDTNLGVKWSVRDRPADSFRTSFAISLYVEFPTGSAQQGLGSGLTDYWLNFIAQKPLSPTTRYNINLGVLFAGNTSTGAVGIQTRRGQVYTGGISLLHDVSSRLTLGAELNGGVSDGAGADRAQLQGLLGMQYAIRAGLSVSCGILGGKFGATPVIGGQLGAAMDFPDAAR